MKDWSTDRPINQQTDMRVLREATLSKNTNKRSWWMSWPSRNLTGVSCSRWSNRKVFGSNQRVFFFSSFLFVRRWNLILRTRSNSNSHLFVRKYGYNHHDRKNTKKETEIKITLNFLKKKLFPCKWSNDTALGLLFRLECKIINKIFALVATIDTVLFSTKQNCSRRALKINVASQMMNNKFS